MSSISKEYPLHKAVLENDQTLFSRLISESDLDKRDVHGNTPLLLSTMCGRHEMTTRLLEAGARVIRKNFQGWTALDECRSFGHKETMTQLYKAYRKEREDDHMRNLSNVAQVFRKIDDFYMELRWEVHSWVPLISRYLPNDNIVIYKKGSKMRVDLTLIEQIGLKQVRGHRSDIFDASAANPAESTIKLDHVSRCFCRGEPKQSETEMAMAIGRLQTTDIRENRLSIENVGVEKRLDWLFRTERIEQVEDCTAQLYKVEGLVMETNRRREHLTTAEVKENKKVLNSLKNGSARQADISTYGCTEPCPRKARQALMNRPSLLPPLPTAVSWTDYINSEPGKHPELGRRILSSRKTKSYAAAVAMTDDFPMSLETLLSILKVMQNDSPNLEKIIEFCQHKLPPGFPARIEIPVFPTVTAKVTFEHLTINHDSLKDPQLFAIPHGYKEDAKNFQRKHDFDAAE